MNNKTPLCFCRALRMAMAAAAPGAAPGGPAAEEGECEMEVLLPHGSSMVVL